MQLCLIFVYVFLSFFLSFGSFVRSFPFDMYQSCIGCVQNKNVKWTKYKKEHKIYLWILNEINPSHIIYILQWNEKKRRKTIELIASYSHSFLSTQNSPRTMISCIATPHIIWLCIYEVGYLLCVWATEEEKGVPKDQKRFQQFMYAINKKSDGFKSINSHCFFFLSYHKLNCIIHTRMDVSMLLFLWSRREKKRGEKKTDGSSQASIN